MIIEQTPVEHFYSNLHTYLEELNLLLDPDTKKRGRKRTNKMYFTPITEKAIVAYNTETIQSKRDRIYNEHIHYALWKLSQNIINRFKFPYMFGSTEDKQYEVIGFLLQKLDKYTEDKGRAFSYFSIVAKNYCIQTNNKAYAKLISKNDLSVLDANRNTYNEEAEQNRRDSMSDFMELFIEYYETRIEKIYTKRSNVKIAYAILELFRRRANIEKYNKKALYLLIREMTNESTKDISKVVNFFKKEYTIKYENYEK